MSKKVFITRKIPEVGIKMLRDKGYEVDVYPKDKVLPKKKLIHILKKGGYDGVISLLTDKIDVSVFEAAPSVKIYSNYATGFDNIDITEAKKRVIVVANAPADLASEAVAEHTIALMLALAARVVEADEFVRRGHYEGWAPMNFIGTDILGKTLGLIGAGRIGEKVAKYGKALGMKILYTDVVKNDCVEKDCGANYCASVEEVLKQSDIVSIHVPLLDSTKHLMNDERFSIMKPTAFLVNTSRGSIIEEKALENALRKNIIAGAALDVFEFEPKISSGLLQSQKIILTPHIASASIEARNQMAELAAQNIIDFFEGVEVKHIVNP